jgi:transcriptional regulator of arginine metabolism
MEIIREIMATNPPSSQSELVRELAARGMKVDQSTVSRDLREMGALRLPGKQGGTIYGLPGEINLPVADEELRRGLRDYAISLETSRNILVLRTAPGNAHALAAILDRSRREEIAGTVAGDDTIIVVVREGRSARKLAGLFAAMAQLS